MCLFFCHPSKLLALCVDFCSAGGGGKILPALKLCRRGTGRRGEVDLRVRVRHWGVSDSGRGSGSGSDSDSGSGSASGSSDSGNGSGLGQ